jgi:hypothetical protein
VINTMVYLLRTIAKYRASHGRQPGRRHGPPPKPPVDRWAVQPKAAAIRAQGYLDQTGRGALTAKQSRRLEKKAARAAKLRYAAESTIDTGESL